ncbi:MAG: nickel-dependent lactate racemase [Candidatus Odinarchaeota archaeon]
MRNIKIDYGKTDLEISLEPNWNTTIIRPLKQEVIENPRNVIKNWIKNPINTPPLKEIVDQKKQLNQICIVVSDATRPVPSYIILEALIAELNDYGIKDNQILVLIATGLHRATYDDELERIIGNDLLKRINYINHDAKDNDSLIYLGDTEDDVPIYVNKYYYESDLKVLTGYVEPHFFFGFSGGRKSIVPGISGALTIQANHSVENIDSPYSRFGIYENNPMAKNSTEIARLAGVDFVINVCIDEEHRITQVAAGELEEVHKKLVDYQLKYIFKEIGEPYDIVICGNGGYPLDLNLYQAVKSMGVGELAVKEGGTIISVNECIDGIGVGHDEFKEILFSKIKPEEIYRKALSKEITMIDIWEIQILTRIMMKAEIYVISTINRNELGNIGLKYAESVEEAIRVSLEKHGPNARILVLPNGPQIIPILKEK